MSTHYVIYVGPSDHGKVPMLAGSYDTPEDAGEAVTKLLRKRSFDDIHVFIYDGEPVSAPHGKSSFAPRHE
jgi:hypothetical protein